MFQCSYSLYNSPYIAFWENNTEFTYNFIQNKIDIFIYFD